MTSFGFNTKDEREESELEKELGFRFLKTDKDKYAVHRDKNVAVYAGSGIIYGVYRGTNENNLVVLLPAILREFTPFNEYEQDKGVTKFYWEKTRPVIIELGTVSGMNPVREEYLESIARGDTVKRRIEQTCEDGSYI